MRLESLFGGKNPLLKSEWQLQDLLELLPETLREMPVVVDPPPPSGLVPCAPSFNVIPRDVMYAAERAAAASRPPSRPPSRRAPASWEGPLSRR
jgi:hypothetical protein